jgi:hypothetical protein
MHFFALFLFFAFGVLALSMLGERAYRRVREARALLSAAWGVALAWLANLNMWHAWSVGNLRYGWVGVTLTGLALGGTAIFLHSIFGFFAGLHRKFDDQAEQMERTELRRVA